MKNNNSKDGFTIIEVSLVLAIAGLIFLMVFVALPALQRQARDTQRREDLVGVVGAIKKFQQNNRGALPNGDAATGVVYSNSASGNNWAGFYHDFLKSDFNDPRGEQYKLNVVKCAKSGSNLKAEAKCDSVKIDDWVFPNNYTIYIIREASCNGETPVKSANKRKAAVLYKLESGGVYCENT